MKHTSQEPLLGNGITFLIILVFAYASVLFEKQWAVVNINLIGGAALLCYVLFGLRMIPGVLIAITVSILIFKQQTNILVVESAMFIFTCTFAPSLSLFIMSSFKKIHISTITSLTFKQILFLTAIQALFCSIFKLFTGVVLIEKVAVPDIADYFYTLFTLDLIGTLVIVYCVIKIITYFKRANSFLV